MAVVAWKGGLDCQTYPYHLLKWVPPSPLQGSLCVCVRVCLCVCHLLYFRFISHNQYDPITHLFVQISVQINFKILFYQTSVPVHTICLGSSRCGPWPMVPFGTSIPDSESLLWNSVICRPIYRRMINDVDWISGLYIVPARRSEAGNFCFGPVTFQTYKPQDWIHDLQKEGAECRNWLM